jgi:effector-binding domain-containing protein
MAAPVTVEASGEKIHRISFTMPAKYTLKTLPEPDDKRIKFKEVKNQKTAVLRFSGRVKKKLALEKMEEIKKWLEVNNLKPKSNYVVAQYNNPAVPGFFRRNEILVEIE